ncbi:MAG: DUF4091 domain-containing protein [Armatimonadetes bacterium]|nr:DUF4091 domain-containing protein [Armatimonadota bacterium]
MRWFGCLMLLIVAGVWAQETVTGPVRIYDTVYDRVDPGSPFTELPRTVEDWLPPKATDAERKAGFILFTRYEPFDIKPWSRPKPNERLTKLSAFAARGEKTNLWFAIFSLEPLQSFAIHVQGHHARPIKSRSVSLEVRYAHFWAQRTDWRGRSYYITPELLLPMKDGKALFPAKGGTLQERSLDIPAGECRLFWLQVSVAENAQPGEHLFTLALKAANKSTLKLPVMVRVLPFRLFKPHDKRWLLYSDSWLLSNLSDERLLVVLKEVADAGINGLTELPFGKLDLTQLKDGKAIYEPGPLLRWLQLMRQVGLQGPHTIGTFIEDQASSALGLTVQLDKEWEEPLKDAMRLIARTVTDNLRPHRFDWLFYGWDEPGPENLRAIQQYRYWREGGAKTYVTFYQRGTYEVAGKWMTHPCFSVGLVNRKETADWARKECDKNGQKFFWYGSGCYLGQEGRMFANRYLTGWLFWKTGADGQVSWTFVRPHEDPFNDFDGAGANSVEPKDQCTVYPQLERPVDYGSIVGIIPTIQWEAIREGITDYRYAYTLKTLINQTRQVATQQRSQRTSPLIQVTKEAEEILYLIEESVPWGNEVGPRNYGNRNLQQVRFLIARQIERLIAALGQKRAVLGERKPREVLVKIRPMPPERVALTAGGPLPVIGIPKLDRPPTIDGQVEVGEWMGAAVTEPFRHYQTGRPMPKEIATRAMVGFDQQNLYIAFICLEPNPQGMRKGQWSRDSDAVWQDEGVEVFLASAQTATRYAHLVVNALGSRYDELVFDVGWNPDYQVATSITADRWTCELAIPWSSLPFTQTLSFHPPSLTLRLNLCRNRHQVDKGLTHWAWSPTFAWYHTPERFGIGMLETSDVVITNVKTPGYFGDDQVILTFHNRTQQIRQIQVDGEWIKVPAKSNVPVALKVKGEVGEHRRLIPLRDNREQRTFEVTYVIPEPLNLVSPIIFADETNEAELPIVINLAPKLIRGRFLVVEVNGRRTRIPLKSPSPQFRCRLQGVSSAVWLWLDKAPRWKVKARLVRGS